jgi:hypothetical protein
LFSYSGNPDFTVNPGFADVKDNSNNDADCNYHVIFHAPPKTESTDQKRLIGGILVPWRYRTTYTQNDRGTVSSTPTIQWTAPPYETLSDVVLDGDMEAAGTGSWSAVNATLAKDTTVFWQGTQSLKVTATSTADAAASQTIITGGKKYVVKGRAKVGSGSGNYPLVNVGGTTWSGTTSTDWQYFRFEVASAAGLTARFYSWNNTVGGVESVYFDDVEVLEATTVTPTASTLYQKNGENQEYGGYLKYTDTLIDGDMELNNVTYWGASGTATRTKTTSSPQEGSRALRITANAAQATGTSIYTYQSFAVSSKYTLVSGRRYLIQGYARSDGTEIPMINITTTGAGIKDVIWSGTTSTSWQFFNRTFVANDTVLQLLFKVASGPTAGTEYVDFDNIRLLEIDGRANHKHKGATQIFDDWDMEFAGVAAFTDTRCTSSKDTTTYKVGTQSLKLLATAGGTGSYYTLFYPGITTTEEYRITGYAKSDGKSVPWVSQDGANSTLWIGTRSQNWQYFDINITAAQTYIALRGGWENYIAGNTNTLNGTEAVWFDQVQVWEVDHDYSGWKLGDQTSKRIVLGNGAAADNFFYVPPSDGGFCAGKLTTRNIQTAALGIWSMPDEDLTLDQKALSEVDVLPKTSIFGYGPSVNRKDIGQVYDLIGFDDNDYEDSIEAMTRRCIFQWGHPVGIYVNTGTVYLFGQLEIVIAHRNLKGSSYPTVTDKNILTAMVVTTTNCSGGAPVTITVTSTHPVVPRTRTWTITSNLTAQLLTDADNTVGTPISSRPNTTFADYIFVTAATSGGSEVLIHTFSLWEDSGLTEP